MNIRDLKQSRFLTQRDIERPVLVTITACKEVNVAMQGAEPDERWTLSFREFDKSMVLNSTNGQTIAAITGSEESDDWIGHQIVIFVDPTISFGGKLVGGIRCRAPKSQTVPQPKPQTFDRTKSIENLRAAQQAAMRDYKDVPVTSPEQDRLAAEIVADNAAAEAAYEQQQREAGEDEV